MKKTSNNAIKRNLLYCGIIAIAVILCGLIYFAVNQKSTPVEADLPNEKLTNSSQSPSSQEVPKKENTTVNIVGVGDNLIHEALYLQAQRRAGGASYDFDFAYKNVADYIKKADIASINQETQLASIFAPSSYPMFNSPTQLGDHMVNIGFDVFNHANNHVLDKGEKGVNSTLDFWKTKPDVKVTGVYQSQEDYDNIRTITKNDITFAFVGMTESTNGLSLPEKSDVKLLRTADKTAIKARIEKAKQMADVVVVNVHWGVEYTNTPNQIQKDLAQDMVDWGADIIFGHHPHVIQPVEYLTRADGSKGIVCYSLGNFISAQNESPRMLGGLLDITVKKDFELNKCEITSAKFVPIITHYGKNYSNVQNYFFKDYTNELAKTHGLHVKNPDFSVEYFDNLVKKVIDEQFLN